MCLVPFIRSIDKLSDLYAPQTPLDDVSFCVLDTETTGGHAGLDRVIDVAVFRMKSGRVEDKFQSLINPGRPIPEWITHLTGIDDGMVKNAPSFEEIGPSLHEFLSQGIFTAHNAAFDYGFIQREFERLGRPYNSPQICTVRLARQLMPELPSRSLGNLCSELLIDISDRHRAHGDAEATAFVLKSFLSDLNRHHNIQTWGDLQAFESLGVLTLPKWMSYQTILQLPETSGTYEFKDQTGAVLSKGKVKNLRRRIQTFFKKTNASKKSDILRSAAASLVCSDLSFE